MIFRLAHENLKDVKLHISLNAPDDKLRKELIPKTDSITRILKAAEYYREFTGNKVELLYVLLRDINDLPKHAEKLSNLLEFENWHVKFLEYNHFNDDEFRRSTREKEFEAVLKKKGIGTERFKTKGDDILASCGQQTAHFLKAWKKNLLKTREYV